MADQTSSRQTPVPKPDAEVEDKPEDDLLAGVLEHVQDGIVVLDRDWHYIYVNQAAAIVLNRAKPDDLIGKQFWTNYLEGVDKTFEQACRKAMKVQQPISLQTYYEPEDRWFENRIYPSPDGLAIYFSEISERRQMEQALHRSHEQLLGFIESAPASIAMFDREMRYLAASHRWLTHYNLGDRDIIGQSHYDIFPEIPDRWRTFHQRGLAGEVVSAEEDWFERLDGSVQWERWVVKPWYTVDDTIGGIIIFTEDITERKQAEEALRQSEVTLQKAQQVAHLGSWTWHIQTNTLEWSDEMYRIFGIDREGFSGELVDVITRAIHPDDRAAVEASNRSVVEGKEAIPLEYRVIHPDGTVRTVWAEAGELILDESGSPQILTGIAQDITERKRAERAIYQLSDTQRQIAHSDSLIDIYQLVGERIQDLIGDGYVAISKLDEQIQAMRVTGLYGFGSLYDQLSRRFKIDPARFVYPLADMTDDELRTFRSGRLEKLEGGLYALLSRKVPKPICDLISQQLKIIGIYTMGFVYQGTHFGGLTVLAKRDLSSYRDMIETIMNQATISINRIRAEQALVQERDLLHTLMENVPDMIYFKDADSRFTRINRAQAVLLGVQSPEEAVGKTDFDFFSPEHAQATRADEQEVIQARKPLIGKVELIQDQAGEPRWVLTTKVPVVDHDQVKSIIGTTKDITEIKQAEEALQRYADRLNILREIDSAILAAHSPVEIARSALRLLDKLVPGQQSSITLFDFEAGEFTRLAVKVDGKQDLLYGVPPGARSPLEHFFTEWDLLRQNQISVRDDLQAVAQASPILDALLADGLRSLINVPLVFQSELIGSLNLASDSPGYFTAERQEIAREVASQLAIAIQQARLDETEREQRVLAESLRDTARIVNSSLDLDEVLKDILSSVSRVVPHNAALVWLIEEDQARVVGNVGFKERGGEQALRALRLTITNTRNMREALQSGKPVVIRDTRTYDGWVSTESTSWIRSLVTVPVKVRDRTLGFLNLAQASPDFYTESHAERLQAFADQAATAIQNARLYNELETYSSILEQAVEERTMELLQQKEQAEAILQSAADAMAIIDPQGLFLEVNPAFVRQTGYAVDEAVGQHIWLLSSESSGSSPLKEAITAAQSARPWRMETQITRKDGSQFDADVSMAPLNQGQNGKLQGFVIGLHDISLFKEVERMKDDFLSTAAHELRTPLTSVQGFSEILLTRELPEDRQKTYLDTINKQSTQLAQIIDDLLDISRLEAGKGLDLNPEPVDMTVLVTEALQPFVDTSPSHRFVLDGLAESPPVQGDPFRLGQVVRNLLSNAVKYSPDGGLVVVRAETEGDYLAISVEDKGLGMTPEQQAHLFERFYRADAVNRSIGGTGLGLTICKLIVDGHGGQMRVVSEYGMGSTFTFTVPLAEQGNNKEAPDR